jgi:hydroxyacid-oxoacid transhydrogenase
MVNDPVGSEEARSKMCLASSSAGMGFGNAGVHLCHGMSYAVASQVKDGYWTEGYPQTMHGNNFVETVAHNVGDGYHHGLIAHGLSVAINAPAVFRFTGKPGQIRDPMVEKYSQDRHAECALILYNARMQRQLNKTSSSSMTQAISEKAIRQHPGEALSNELLELMHLLNIPVGLHLLGYSRSDVNDLARATLPQHRVTQLSPRQPIELEELQDLFTDAM